MVVQNGPRYRVLRHGRAHILTLTGQISAPI